MEIKKLIKKKFYSSKEAILLDSIDLSKIVVSSRWKLNDIMYKYFCGYLNNDVIKPLFIILPQMNGDILSILKMVEKICHLLQMMKKFVRNIMKYGM